MTKNKSKSKKAANKYKIELTSLSLFLWGGCLFFILVWIFVLGILVGRGFLSGSVTVISDLKSQINKLPGMVSTNKSQDRRSQKKSDPNPKFAFYEKLSIKKDEAKKNWNLERKVEKTKKEPFPMKVKTSQEKPQEKKKEGIGNQKKKPELPIPETHYTVQLASLGDKIGAEKFIKKLIAQGYPAYSYEVRVKDKTYYRIRCGRFMSRKEAKGYARKLKREEGHEGFVSKLE